MLHDMYLFQVKTPEESRQPYDYCKLPSTVPGDKAFRPLSARECPLVRAATKKAWRARGFEEQTAPKSR
jgi:branched-chain amino acid transport system substrate-binding protein